MRELAGRVDSDWDAIRADLETIRAAVLTSQVRRRSVP